jgi:hypothetical protein
MDTIKFPIEFDSSGLKKLVEGSADYYSQMLTIALLTEPHTLPFTPKFGVFSPEFSDFDKNLFVLNAARFVPEIEITSLSTNSEENGTVKTTFSFVIKEQQ